MMMEKAWQSWMQAMRIACRRQAFGKTFFPTGTIRNTMTWYSIAGFP